MTSPPEPPPPTQRVAAILVAAGDSTRLGLIEGKRKPFAQLAGRTLIERACAAFAACEGVTEIVIVAQPEDHATLRELAQASPAFEKLTKIVEGGRTRTDSVRAGVEAASADIDLVAIHDAARPLVTPEIIEAAIDLAAREGSALVAVPANDTTKLVDERGRSKQTLDRSTLWLAQTPQLFRRAAFLKLLERAASDDFTPTDDAALHEHYSGPVPISPCDASNMKITHATDLELAAALLRVRAEEAHSS